MYNEKSGSLSELCIKQNSKPQMKNNSQKNITNSRVGRRWPKENLHQVENETSGDFSMSSNNTMEELDSK